MQRFHNCSEAPNDHIKQVRKFGCNIKSQTSSKLACNEYPAIQKSISDVPVFLLEWGLLNSYAFSEKNREARPIFEIGRASSIMFLSCDDPAGTGHTRVTHMKDVDFVRYVGLCPSSGNSPDQTGRRRCHKGIRIFTSPGIADTAVFRQHPAAGAVYGTISRRFHRCQLQERTSGFHTPCRTLPVPSIPMRILR